MSKAVESYLIDCRNTWLMREAIGNRILKFQKMILLPFLYCISWSSQEPWKTPAAVFRHFYWQSREIPKTNPIWLFCQRNSLIEKLNILWYKLIIISLFQCFYGFYQSFFVSQAWSNEHLLFGSYWTRPVCQWRSIKSTIYNNPEFFFHIQLRFHNLLLELLWLHGWTIFLTSCGIVSL